MINFPTTKEEASKYGYGRIAPNHPTVVPYREDNCAYEVWADIRWGSYQCTRKNGHGAAKLYCKQHANKIKEREGKQK